MRICPCCDTVFEDTIVPYSPCPIRFCGGDIIDIDENLYEVYCLLNEKGYTTRNACSGHSGSSYPQTYIQFFGQVGLPCIPAGFKVETRLIEEGEMVTNLFKRHPANLSSTELQRRLWATARTLLNWAEQLECCEEFE